MTPYLFQNDFFSIKMSDLLKSVVIYKHNILQLMEGCHTIKYNGDSSSVKISPLKCYSNKS